MLYGMEVYNADGTLQFNAIARNAVFMGKGTHSTSTNSSTSPIGTRSRLDITSSLPPLVAFRPQGGQMCVYQQGTSSPYQFNIMAQSFSIDWWAFTFDPPGASGFGLEVYDAASNITFSSAAAAMKVVLSQAATGHVYAIVSGALSGVRSWDRGALGDITKYWQQSHWDGITSSADGHIGIQRFIADRDTGTIRTSALPDVVYSPLNYLVVDVTGL